MEHLDVIDFVRSHFDESGRIIKNVATLYDITDVNYETQPSIEDLLSMVSDMFGEHMIETAIETIEEIDG